MPIVQKPSMQGAFLLLNFPHENKEIEGKKSESDWEFYSFWGYSDFLLMCS